LGRESKAPPLAALATDRAPLPSALVLGLDAAAIAAALYLGYLVRFEGHVPDRHLAEYWRFLPLLLVVRLPLHVLSGIARWSFRLAGLCEAVRVILTCAYGSACFVATAYVLPWAVPPRSVVAMEFFFTASLLGALRFAPRYARHWLLDRVRSRTPSRVRALIVGAGSAGELLLRDLGRSGDHSYDIVGFVDDDGAKWGTSIGGRPVLGSLEQLPPLARARDVQELLFAIPRLPASRLREIVAACADLKLSYKILPVSFAYLNERVSMGMLQQLAPEDLLHRTPISFDAAEMRALITGRRMLVTGAGGSIGSEICRQAAAYDPTQLVLADVNENELYLLYRHIQQRHPRLDVRAEVVDIRDEERVRRLGVQYRFQDVFHAAAHKHVPLMEQAPEEAIKNNVTGCRNVAAMADATGVERFVLISTDKAVDPSSVMGASKRIAELVVRDQAQRSATRFTAVRFGNVLGSAGSVVPLFKAQIAAGGPVTVTHRDCRRYIMTIREAVGLVLLAGLGRQGDLCMLEMGEPIRILDLARLMITLAGLAPERDVPITFIGLRAGEKIDEVLMTDEEAAASRQLRRMIRSLPAPPPGPGVMARVGALEAAARTGDRTMVIKHLRAVLPNYTPSPSWAAAAEEVTILPGLRLPVLSDPLSDETTPVVVAAERVGRATERLSPRPSRL
jgi:FlaA1/EpsC-like NDP-sugar epimerase